MRTILGLVLVALFAYLGSALFRVRRLAPSLRALIGSGLGFFAIGLLLGPLAIALLGAEEVSQLDVLIDLGVGWVGLLFGLQFHWGDLRRLPGRHYLGAGLEALMSMLVCAGPLWLMLADWGFEATAVPLLIGVLAAAGSTSSPTVMALVHQYLSPRGQVTDWLRLSNAVDALPAVLILGALVAFAPVRPAVYGSPWDGLFWIGVACLLGLAMGALFHLLTLYRYSDAQRLVIVLGLVVFCGGAAHYLVLSPLFVNFVVGVVVANRSPMRQRVLQAMLDIEKPIYLILLTLAGALWRPLPAGMWWIVVAFVGLRLVGKWLGGQGGARLAGLPAQGLLGLGPGLFDHGGMALAIALGFGQLFSEHMFQLVLTCALASMLLTTLIGPWCLRQTLVRAGEVS